MSLAQPRTDKEYEARWDAETLANAERIKADPSRLGSAQAAAKAIADQKDEDQKAMRKVAGRRGVTDKGVQGGTRDAPPLKNPNGGIQQSYQSTPKGTSNGYNVFKQI